MRVVVCLLLLISWIDGALACATGEACAAGGGVYRVAPPDGWARRDRGGRWSRGLLLRSGIYGPSNHFLSFEAKQGTADGRSAAGVSQAGRPSIGLPALEIAPPEGGFFETRPRASAAAWAGDNFRQDRGFITRATCRSAARVKTTLAPSVPSASTTTPGIARSFRTMAPARLVAAPIRSGPAGQRWPFRHGTVSIHGSFRRPPADSSSSIRQRRPNSTSRSIGFT